MEIFRITGHLCGAFTVNRWFLLTKASDGELKFFFFDLRINERVNNHEAGDLWRHRAQYDVIVMEWISLAPCSASALCSILFYGLSLNSC